MLKLWVPGQTFLPRNKTCSLGKLLHVSCRRSRSLIVCSSLPISPRHLHRHPLQEQRVRPGLLQLRWRGFHRPWRKDGSFFSLFTCIFMSMTPIDCLTCAAFSGVNMQSSSNDRKRAAMTTLWFYLMFQSESSSTAWRWTPWRPGSDWGWRRTEGASTWERVLFAFACDERGLLFLPPRISAP